MNLSKNSKLTLVKAAQTAGTSAVNSDGVDMDGFVGVMFFGTIATAAANNIANAAQGTDNAAFTDLAGTGISPGDNGDSFLVDVYQPEKRYVRCEIARGTSTATGDIYALQYRTRKAPTTQGATIDAETHVSPIEGTA